MKVNISFTLRNPSGFLRLPKNYSVVLEVLRAAGHGVHLSANDIFLRARERQPKLGFSTVHRALARLHRASLILKIDVPGTDAVVYETAAPPHAHFWCEECSEISDIDYVLPKRVLRELAERGGVEIHGEALSLIGRCRKCMPRRARGRRGSASSKL
jgi:Fe2+ or Zn2+ uptake regulation protein